MPAAKPPNTFEDWKVVPSFEYVRMPVPPDAVALIDPKPVVHNGLVPAAEAVMADGIVIVTLLLVLGQPPEPCTVTVCGPAATLL